MFRRSAFGLDIVLLFAFASVPMVLFLHMVAVWVQRVFSMPIFGG
jgi:hypothetical protein